MWSVTVTGDIALKFLSLGRVRLCCPSLSPPHSRSVCLSLSCDSLTGDLLSVEQAHSMFYILQDYSSLTLVERRGGWMLEVVVVVREQETDNY